MSSGQITEKPDEQIWKKKFKNSDFRPKEDQLNIP